MSHTVEIRDSNIRPLHKSSITRPLCKSSHRHSGLDPESRKYFIIPVFTYASEDTGARALASLRVPLSYFRQKNLEAEPQTYAFGKLGDREKTMAAGCSGYIEKPINPETFTEQIREFLPGMPQGKKVIACTDV